MTTGLGNVKLELVDSVEQAHNFITWLSQKRPSNAVAIDIETGEIPGNDPKDALSPWKGRIRLVQVGDAQTGWSIPWEQWAGAFYQAMKRYDGMIIFHNVAFEAKWFELQSEWKIPWHNAHDTMLMAQVAKPTERAGLKPLSERYVDGQAADLQGTLQEEFAKNGWTWGTVPISYEPYWAYGALDTILTMRIWEELWKDCGPGEKYNRAYEIEMATRRIAIRMELNGARVDLDYSQKALDDLNHQTSALKQWMKDNYNGTSISSPIQLVRLFEEKLSFEVTETTASGSKSMTKDQLDMIVRDGNAEAQVVAGAVLRYRKADKIAGSYFTNFLKDNINGYVHPSIRTMGARTGRSSITDPALQTLPSKDPLVRMAFIPKDEDHGIISSDLDQVEFRLTANFSQDPALIALFHEADRTGGDVFTQIMCQVYDDNSLVKADPRRQLIKGVVYGKLYGAGAEKMALTAGVKTAQMKAVIDAFDKSYPGIKTFQKNIENVGMQRLRNEGEGYVLTQTGRRLPCDADRVYSLTNYLIQATAAEVFKMNLIKLDSAGLTENLIVPVHDEIVLQAHKDESEDVMQAVQECMTTTEGWDIPLTSGVEGPFTSWGEKYLKKD